MFGRGSGMKDHFRRQKMIDIDREKRGLPPLEKARKKRKSTPNLDVEDADSNTAVAATSTEAVQYANGRTSTPEQGKKRIENKKMGAHRYREIIKYHADDEYVLKWKVRHLCRLNPKLQYDVADAALLNTAGMNIRRQELRDEFDAAAEKRAATDFLQSIRL